MRAHARWAVRYCGWYSCRSRGRYVPERLPHELFGFGRRKRQRACSAGDRHPLVGTFPEVNSQLPRIIARPCALQFHARSRSTRLTPPIA